MVIAVAACSVGDIALKRGVNALPAEMLSSFGVLGRVVILALEQPWIVAGILLMLVHFAAFIRALQLGPLSAAVPLRSGTYIFTTFLARFYLHERVTPIRWLAILVVLMGVSLVGHTTGEER